MDKHKITKEKRVLAWQPFVVLIFVCFIAAVFIFRQAGVISPIPSAFVPTPTPDLLQPKTVVLLGYGGGAHDGGLLTDTIIVARILPKDHKVFLISVPRDLWVELPITSTQSEHSKINAAYAIGNDDAGYKNKLPEYTGNNGGGNLAKAVIGNVVGMPIDAYVAISFDGFIKTMKILGPVEVDVPFSFVDEFYPIDGKEKDSCGKTDDEIKTLSTTYEGFELEKQFTCRYERLSFTKGKQTMDATTALKFVRSRHSDVNGNDFGRSLRQQALLKAVKQKVFSLGTVTKIVPLLQSGLAAVDTDINLPLVIDSIRAFGDISSYTISSIALTDQNVLMDDFSEDKQFILAPKDKVKGMQSIKDYIQEQIATTSATVTP